MTDDGKPYYQNLLTKETRWRKPPGWRNSGKFPSSSSSRSETDESVSSGLQRPKSRGVNTVTLSPAAHGGKSSRASGEGKCWCTIVRAWRRVSVSDGYRMCKTIGPEMVCRQPLRARAWLWWCDGGALAGGDACAQGPREACYGARESTLPPPVLACASSRRPGLVRDTAHVTRHAAHLKARRVGRRVGQAMPTSPSCPQVRYDGGAGTEAGIEASSSSRAHCLV